MPGTHAASRSRRWLTLALATLATVTATLVVTTPAEATPPRIPAESTARRELSSLTVADEGSMTGYSRDKFPHWITIEGKCDTRETVLNRDGTNLDIGTDCYPDSGSWYSPYDGATWTRASDVDIDHVVPLAEAWRSGASSWTQSQRQNLANELFYPQLIAVTDNVNQSKGDRDPTQWLPPSESYHCTYAKMWIHIKYHYDLTAQAEEKAVLRDLLDTCS